MNRKQLVEQIRLKKSYLCVGLDTDLARIPRHLLSHSDPVFEFNRLIIDATRDHCVAYKINTAFYEALGLKGWDAMQKTVDYIPATHFKIADAKRGDIGNTSSQYARAFFETLRFDAITLTPYMGEDSIRPFLEYKDKWAIVLGLTSNSGAKDFELIETGRGYLYEEVLTKASRWGTTENMMFVIGATQPEYFDKIRKITPDHFYLVPGIGAQGGSLEAISQKAINKDIGLLVNVSRDIIYASEKENFAEEATRAVASYQASMKNYIKS